MKPFLPFLIHRLTQLGPAQERTSAIYYKLWPVSGFEDVHYTPAGPLLLSLLRAVLPRVHLVLMDHNTCLTCLWKVEESKHLAVGEVDPLPQGSIVIEEDLIWKYGPKGDHAWRPGGLDAVAAIIVTLKPKTLDRLNPQPQRDS